MSLLTAGTPTSRLSLQAPCIPPAAACTPASLRSLQALQPPAGRRKHSRRPPLAAGTPAARCTHDSRRKHALFAASAFSPQVLRPHFTSFHRFD
ncbi:hypothetical protein Scep_017144 [Stephania cephalantha]|uniref:Uncharacterized protein n=1 Tax=Stephania cephalantha TaxID=152367 RepID=A0AAP0NWL9_9MAGN